MKESWENKNTLGERRIQKSKISVNSVRDYYTWKGGEILRRSLLMGRERERERKKEKVHIFSLISGMQYFQGKFNLCIPPRCSNTSYSFHVRGGLRTAELKWSYDLGALFLGAGFWATGHWHWQEAHCVEEHREPYRLQEDPFPFSLCQEEKVFELGLGGLRNMLHVKSHIQYSKISMRISHILCLKATKALESLKSVCLQWVWAPYCCVWHQSLTVTPSQMLSCQ